MAQKTSFLLSVSVLGLVFGGGMAALAEGDGVIERARPEYDAKGMPLGAFRLFPLISVGVSHDDNIYRLNTGTKSDFFFDITPRVTLQSQWSQHALNLYGGANFLEYNKYSSENQTNWDVGADLRLDVQRGTQITGNGSYRQTHEQRFSPDSPGNLAEPTAYTLLHGGGEFAIKPNRLGFAVGASIDKYDYDSTPFIGGGVLNNNDRDRNQYQVYGRASYDFSPGYSFFMRGTYDARSFSLNTDRTGVNRDSTGYRIDGGVDMLLTRLITGQVFVGYLEQDYKAPLTDISGVDYGIALTWYASELATFHLNAAHILNDTTLGGASASDDQTISGGIDYELLRNVIVLGTTSYTHSNFRGNGRKDNAVTASLGLRYLINPYIRADLRYQYSNRDSSIAGQDFKDNLVSIGLTFQQ